MTPSLAVCLAQYLASLTVDQWDALGSILGGVGSIAAVVGAATLLGVQARAWRREARQFAEERRWQAEERREEAQRRRDEEAQQARLIIARLGDWEPNPEDPENTIEQSIDVTNHSDGFFLDIIVRIPGTDLRRLIHYIAPGKTESTEFRYLAPDYHVSYVSCGGPYTPYELRVTLEFTDSSGRRWRREGWDQPQQLPAQLSDSSFYRYLPPTPSEGHPYDSELRRLGLGIQEPAE